MKIPETWADWCRVFNDRDYWYDEILSILDSVGIPPEQIVCGYPGTNAVFEVNDEYILKIFLNVLPNSFRKELYIHSQCLPQDTVYPSVLFHGRSAHGFDYLVFNKLDGTSLREYYHANIPVSHSTARELGQIIGTLHEQTKDMQPMEGVEYRKNTDHSQPVCLVNYDITEDHVFIDRNGRITAIIDFGDACLAHPSHEFPALFAAGLNCDPELISAFQSGYEESCSFGINYDEIVSALLDHDFSEDILEYIKRIKTGFSDMILSRIDNLERWEEI
jgi:hypothetical protein